jgi:hypothetical protein
MLAEGTWWITSKSDSRWKASGRTEVGMFAKPQEAKNAVEDLKAKLGDPPSDLEWGYMKD